MGNTKTYLDAITCLNNLQSGAAALKHRRENNVRLSKSAVTEMKEWIRHIGYSASDLKKLKVVHIAGTKGKGTVCKFVENLLIAHQTKTGLPRKIGLYTSPHVVDVRERICVNGSPISEENFARYFFEVWEKFQLSGEGELGTLRRLTYFRYLTLLSIHVYLQEGVDIAIYETGVGGELDSTNIFEHPEVTAITTIGKDHVVILGSSYEDIAWHKAGIFKSGSPAFSVGQRPAVEEILRERANAKAVKLEIITSNPVFRYIKVYPDEEYQRLNASLAVVVAETTLKGIGLESMPEELIRSLENTRLPGRSEIILDGDIRWCLDVAHNEDSLDVAATWFGKTCQLDPASHIPRILIFNQQSTRDTAHLLTVLHKSLHIECGVDPQHVIFCTNLLDVTSDYKIDFVNQNMDKEALKSLELQKRNAALWEKLGSRANIAVKLTVAEAMSLVRTIGQENGGAKVFVTGSLHLVCGVRWLLSKTMESR